MDVTTTWVIPMCQQSSSSVQVQLGVLRFAVNAWTGSTDDRMPHAVHLAKHISKNLTLRLVLTRLQVKATSAGRGLLPCQRESHETACESLTCRWHVIGVPSEVTRQSFVHECSNVAIGRLASVIIASSFQLIDVSCSHVSFLACHYESRHC